MLLIHNQITWVTVFTSGQDLTCQGLLGLEDTVSRVTHGWGIRPLRRLSWNYKHRHRCKLHSWTTQCSTWGWKRDAPELLVRRAAPHQPPLVLPHLDLGHGHALCNGGDLYLQNRNLFSQDPHFSLYLFSPLKSRNHFIFLPLTYM